MSAVRNFAIASVLVIVQAGGSAFAEDKNGHDARQPALGQENSRSSANSEAVEMNSKATAEQAPKFGRIEKGQTQGFRFSDGSRF